MSRARNCSTCRHHLLEQWDEPCDSCHGHSRWEAAAGAAPPAPEPPPEVVARVAELEATAPEPPPDPYHAAKHDLGKLRWDCLPWPAVEQVVLVLTFGANKYSAWSWPSVPDARRRYFAAMVRHAVAWLRGERLDPESGLPHLAHLACNALFLLSFELGEAAEPAALAAPPPAREP